MHKSRMMLVSLQSKLALLLPSYDTQARPNRTKGKRSRYHAVKMMMMMKMEEEKRPMPCSARMNEGFLSLVSSSLPLPHSTLISNLSSPSHD